MLGLLPLLPSRTSLVVALGTVAATIAGGFLAEERGGVRERAVWPARASALGSSPLRDTTCSAGRRLLLLRHSA